MLKCSVNPLLMAKGAHAGFDVEDVRSIPGIQTLDNQCAVLDLQQSHRGDADRIRATRAPEREQAPGRTGAISPGVLQHRCRFRRCSVEPKENVQALDGLDAGIEFQGYLDVVVFKRGT